MAHVVIHFIRDALSLSYTCSPAELFTASVCTYVTSGIFSCQNNLCCANESEDRCRYFPVNCIIRKQSKLSQMVEGFQDTGCTDSNVQTSISILNQTCLNF